MKTAQEVLESKLPKNRDVFPYCEVLEAMQDFATLHAQKIADKMVEERMREELIKFAETKWDDLAFRKTQIVVDEYLKSR